MKFKHWITKGILKSIKQKISYTKIFAKTTSLIQLKKEYKIYKNKLTKIKTISKKAYSENRLKHSTKNTSKIWKVINDIKCTNKQKKYNKLTHKLDINEKSFSKPIDIVNKLNAHFTDIVKHTRLKNVAP